MTAVKYLKVYECAIKSRDKKSGKAVNNILHFRSGIQETDPPNWGEAIAGASLEVFCTNLSSRWLAEILPVLSVNYDDFTTTIKEITGWSTGGPTNVVTQATNTSPIVISTGLAHNLTTGDAVLVAGCTGNTAANGTWVITVVDATSFSLDTSVGNGIFTGNGVWSKLNVPIHFTYGDAAELVTTSTGGLSGDALPLFASLSAKKITGSAGRNWRGGVRMAPVAESSCVDGKFTTTAHANNVTACSNFIDPGIENGGSASASRRMYCGLLSKALAFQAATPFAQSDSYWRILTNLIPSRNNGSVVRRKPKLSAAIA